MLRLIKRSDIGRLCGSLSKVRCFSTLEPCGNVEGAAVLKFNSAPVNAMSFEFMTHVNKQLDEIEQSKEIRGVILASSLPTIFCAGLNIHEMYNKDKEYLQAFWTTLQDFWYKFYSSKKVYISAINGHAPAGGCLITVVSDYRIMKKGPFKIGLNESLLGVVVPFWLKDTMVNTVGHRETEKQDQLGLLYSPEEALRINLVDELAENDQDLMQRAEKQIQQWLKIPTFARQTTKTLMRQTTLDNFMRHRQTDVTRFVEHISLPENQQFLESYINSLKSRSKSSK